jgi:hypothetical protein
MSYALVRRAILERKAVFAIYHGLYREFCPHVIGVEHNGAQALCYQFGGQSHSRLIQPNGSPDNWRCFAISELSDVTIHDSEWHSAPDRTRPRGCVEFVDIDVRDTPVLLKTDR